MNTMIVNGEKTGKAAAKIQSQNFLQLGKLNECGVEWEECSNVTPRGGMALFGNFLAANGQFDGLVESCPLEYQSNNAPDKSQVLGTIVNAITNGAWRYAHISHYQKDALGADVLAAVPNNRDSTGSMHSSAIMSGNAAIGGRPL